jgi:hypothetical protein
MFRQLLTESLLLGSFGGIAGVWLAIAMVQAAADRLPDSLPRLAEIGTSWPMLIAAIVLTSATGLICGLAPALESVRPRLMDSVRDGGHGASHGRGQSRLRSGMVVVEVGMAMVLLVSAGLLLRSFAKMLEVDPGFETSHALTASLSLPAHDYPTQRKVDDFLAELQQRLQANPRREVGWLCLEYPNCRSKIGTSDCARRLYKIAGRRLDYCLELPHPRKLLRSHPHSPSPWPLFHPVRRRAKCTSRDRNQPVVGPSLFSRQGPDRHAHQGRAQLCFVNASHDHSRSRRRHQTRRPRRSHSTSNV